MWQSAQQLALPDPVADIQPLLIDEGTHYTGDQETLPLSPLWIACQLRETTAFCEGEEITGEETQTVLVHRGWRGGYLAERMQDEILQKQILIETKSEYVGQVSASSVIEPPSYPCVSGKPSRISCVVHVGDGEFIDVERKTELGGNTHTKGMMTIQAFLMPELELEQQLPFSTSLIFKQSYNEVDGDSTSMAELCALISVLASTPINQSITITSSVDQLGRVRSAGGLNEKIEGFLTTCQQRGLTGKQGIIILMANVRHLSLSHELRRAVAENQFVIWVIDDITEALPMLTQLMWDDEGQTPRQTIQEWIAQTTQ